MFEGLEMNADITMNEPRPLWKAEDVAQVLGISTKTVHKLVRERKLSCVQINSRGRRFAHPQKRCFQGAPMGNGTLTRICKNDLVRGRCSHE
jgi:hypothetical protein